MNKKIDFKIDLDNMFEDILEEKQDIKMEQHKFEIFNFNQNIRDIPTNNKVDIYYTKIKEIFDECSEYRGRLFLCGGFLRYFLNYHLKPKHKFEMFEMWPKGGYKTIKSNDIDLYCKDQETFDGIKHIFRYKIRIPKKFETENAITYKKWKELPSFQLIKPLQEGRMITMGSLEEILRNFDFSVIRVGLDHDMLEKKQALVDVDFKRDELNHDIIIKNVHCPVSSLQRVIKYCKKGYSIKAKELIKLFEDWDDRDAKYKNDLKTFFQKLSSLSPTQIKNTYARMNFD